MLIGGAVSCLGRRIHIGLFGYERGTIRRKKLEILPKKVGNSLLTLPRISCMIFKQFWYAPLAQLVEHLTLNQGVPGSSP